MFPDLTLCEGKGSSTVEHFLGCAESAVLFSNQIAGICACILATLAIPLPHVFYTIPDHVMVCTTKKTFKCHQIQDWETDFCSVSYRGWGALEYPTPRLEFFPSSFTESAIYSCVSFPHRPRYLRTVCLYETLGLCLNLQIAITPCTSVRMFTW